MTNTSTNLVLPSRQLSRLPAWIAVADAIYSPIRLKMDCGLPVT
jgi:hypothetical protein